MRLLIRRDQQPEWMDQQGLEKSLHTEALRGLARLNAWSGSSRILWRPLRQLASECCGPVRVLDMACGGGDVAVRLARRALRDQVELRLTGCDRSDTALDYARRRAEHAGVSVDFVRLDVCHDPLPGEFDAVITSLFLHHLHEAEAISVLRRAGSAARRLVLVNDLIRSVPGYWLAVVATRLLTRSPVVHVDGPRSVAGAFTLAEVLELSRQAGLDGTRVARRWPERFLLEYWKA